ncbi:MAG TPA: NAD-dependent dihydropyrimidine dehydrogenase subunit PreA [Candidatus Wallbacteria bacterium]|nr:NAD-dependent dihydropyrimidine dehydrogenase subunit PreA [Candidatus Wallbacteria bacterium]
MVKKADISVDFCGVRFENPFMLSSSPVTDNYDMCARAYKYGWGGVVYKTLNLEKKFKIYMPSPRLNALHLDDKRVVGLQNLEQISDRTIKDNIKDIKKLKKDFPEKVLISSIMGYSDADWTELAGLSEEAGADMLELNFSCPQMAREGAGHKVGQSFELMTEFLRAARKGSKLPIMAKMTPNITDMVPAALAAKEGGADAISAINTVKSITGVNIDEMVPMPTIDGQSSISGYSGTAVKPIALRFITELVKDPRLKLPISGIGGIVTWIDAVEFLLLGATTLQVTTGIMKHGQRIVEDMIEGLSDYMIDKGFKSVKQMVGLALKTVVDPSKIAHKNQAISVIDKEKCIGCGQCYISCMDGAHQAISLDRNRKAEVDEDKCVGCLMCYHVCPVGNAVSYKTTKFKYHTH